jgi:prolyl oligopeptidase
VPVLGIQNPSPVKQRVLPIVALLGGIVWVLPAAAADTTAPPTPQHPAVDKLHGVKITDPYRWLEDAASPDVQSWDAAQMAHTRQVLDAIPAHSAIKAKLTALTTGTSASYSALKVAGGRLFAMFNDPKKQQPQLVVMDIDADPSTQAVVLDPNTIDAQGSLSIDWYEPSPDGKLVAVSLSNGGSEDGILHVLETGTGRDVESAIPNVQYPTAGGSVAWVDGESFYYTRFPGPERPEADRHFYQQAYLHKVGRNAGEDPLVLGEKDGLPKVAEIKFDGRYSPGLALASVQLGDGGEFSHWVLRADQPAVRLTHFEDAIVAAAIGPDRMIYMISRSGAPRGKILKMPLAEPDLSRARTIVPEAENAIDSSAWSDALVLTQDRLFVHDIVGGPSDVRIFDHDGRAMGTLPLPPIAAADDIHALPDGSLLYAVATYLRPRYYAVWHAADGSSEETDLTVDSPVHFGDAEVVREFATSKDGTKIPVSIIRRKGARADGNNPTVLYGYGGYGISIVPRFLGPEWRLWLDAGGIYAEANIRGGGEYGEAWHRAGNLTRKQNVFDDFTAAAEHLIARKMTRPERLALVGRSNGGLLMGAMITQHPQIARAVVATVGIYDMLRVELDPNGSFNTTEFGTVKDNSQFRALLAYSPYQHVRPDTRYPAVLFATGVNDGRVNPMQSKKFAAALQAATSSGRPILLRISTSAGHGFGSALTERIDQQADELAFLIDQLGARRKK